MQVFKSQVNGLPFDVENPTAAHLLGSHQKSQFVKPIEVGGDSDGKTKATKGTKPKVSVGTSEDDLEQDVK